MRELPHYRSVVRFPITFEHQGRQFTLSLGSASGTMPLFPRDARGGGDDGAAAAESVVVLEVSGDATQYACGDPGRYRDEDVLKARVTLCITPSGPQGPRRSWP
jgi:hypothetical protein